jgi:hypothetical protein
MSASHESRTASIALLAVAALAACSPKDKPVPAVPASAPAAAQNCLPEAPVKVDHIVISGGNATVTVDPEPRQIGQNAQGVRWTLKSPQGKTYVFAGNGVVFKSGAPPGPAASSANADRSQFVWCFNATAPNSTWAYTIRFVDTTVPGTTWACDPTIINNEVLSPGTAAPKSYTCVQQ